jgi:hypothetical protein
MTKVFAERDLLVEGPEGNTFTTKIQFGIPYESEQHGWLCDISMAGITKDQYAAGHDSLQAVMLSVSLCESILLSKQNKGWQFFYPDTKEVMDVGEMFNLSTFVSLNK